MPANELFEIKGVEVFSTGTWNGNKITSQDLDDMVQAFEDNKTNILPHVKLGHNDNQSLLQSDGLPVAGWIGRLYREGDKLKADLIDIPRKIYQLILNKAYRKVSLEVYHNIKIAGKQFRRMVGAIALLGQELPGVQNLADILANYKIQDHGVIKNFADNTNEATIEVFTFDDSQEKGDEMSKELEQKITDLEAKLEKYAAQDEKLESVEAELADLKKYKIEADAKLEEAAQKEAKAIEDARLKELDADVVKFMADEKLPKSCEQNLKNLLDEKIEKYSLDEKEVSRIDNLRDFVTKVKEASKVNFSENSEEGDKGAGDFKEEEIEKYMSEHKCSYGAAVKALAASKE